MSEIGLWIVVGVVIAGFLAAWEFIIGFKHPQKPMGTAEWGPPGVGKQYPAARMYDVADFVKMCGDPEDERLFFEAEVMLEMELTDKEVMCWLDGGSDDIQ
jgi:hypothetical protein